MVSPPVSEFVKILKAQRHLLSRQDKIQSDAEAVDSVALRFLCGREVWPGLGCGLPLAITHYSDLEPRLCVKRERPHERIVEIEALPGVNPGSRLSGVKLIYLE